MNAGLQDFLKLNVSEKIKLAKIENLSVKLMMSLSCDNNFRVRLELSKNKNISIAVLKKLSLDDNPNVRACIASSLQLDFEDVDLLLNDKDEKVKCNLASNCILNANQIERILSQATDKVMLSICKNPSTPDYVLHNIYNSNLNNCHLAIASHVNTSTEILIELLASKKISIMSCIASNPSSTDSMLCEILEFIKSGFSESVLINLEDWDDVKNGKNVSDYIGMDYKKAQSIICKIKNNVSARKPLIASADKVLGIIDNIISIPRYISSLGYTIRDEFFYNIENSYKSNVDILDQYVTAYSEILEPNNYIDNNKYYDEIYSAIKSQLHANDCYLSKSKSRYQTYLLNNMSVDVFISILKSKSINTEVLSRFNIPRKYYFEVIVFITNNSHLFKHDDELYEYNPEDLLMIFALNEHSSDELFDFILTETISDYYFESKFIENPIFYSLIVASGLSNLQKIVRHKGKSFIFKLFADYFEVKDWMANDIDVLYYFYSNSDIYSIKHRFAALLLKIQSLSEELFNKIYLEYYNDASILILILSNQSVCDSIILDIYKNFEKNLKIIKLISCNKNCPSVLISAIYATHKNNQDILNGLARNTSTSKEILLSLSRSKLKSVLVNLAENPQTPLLVLEELLHLESKVINLSLAGNASIPSRMLEILYLSADKKTKCEIASNPNTPITLMKLLLNEKSVEIRELVAMNHNVPRDLLELLMHDKNSNVRSCARNMLQFWGSNKKLVNSSS